MEEAESGERQVLGVFVKEDAEGEWRAAHWLTFKGRPPQLARDKEGYALAASASELGEAHVRYLGGDDGALVPDSYTSNARNQDMGDWTVERGAVTPGPGESYALRTEDGGALVWYAVKEEKTLAGGKASTLPEEVRAHLEKNGDEVGETVLTTWQWLVIGYAPEAGKGRVLGESVSLVAAR
ncbi:hypothetical protein E1200_24905 [Actinomadura sp. GC306]|uniref:hypothetical protein n=1 Tax=Actinomadura sp. GC306 TaxID=2530367 RepID=UPI0010473687|nr:hypothetical protein [Actinomadura sp. GC306]TDC62670.1 hypothetical protein E1200_24905 [Actinomadura sp. GC306]